jgi:glycosyltransferase involved in cell wall biosynthesis
VIAEDIRSSHALLMPSHFEHLGLVPLEAAGFGVPVLVNGDSGAAMFLAGIDRVPAAIGAPCVVRDFGQAGIRPQLWADAIEGLGMDIRNRFANAALLRDLLARYSWSDAAKVLVAAARRPDWRTVVRSTVQGRDQGLLQRAG